MENGVAAKLIKARGAIPRAVVAQAVGISVSALGMYETGRRVPKDVIKVRFADYYKMSVQELFFSEQTKK